MHKIAESDSVSYLYLITDICLGYLRVGEERMLGKRSFRLITLVCVGVEKIMRGKETKTVLAACVIYDGGLKSKFRFVITFFCFS